MDSLYSSLAKKVKVSPNQNSLFIIYRKDNKIGGKTSQLSSNYSIATELSVTDHQTSKKMYVWMVRLSIRVGFLTLKNWQKDETT